MVYGDMMRLLVGGLSRRVSDQGWDILNRYYLARDLFLLLWKCAYDLQFGQVMQIHSPTPEAYAQGQLRLESF